ncbi:CubicO group peptidase, beta-lactamase class C family [Algoriphagus faecimaris]|uniref:CubicO group peptidase, beta-lactamase class C family n=1 Tax=Algoriphagus faecimaris TaxID=686796 RepID=A0A1G6RJH8_9BACT|nr:serine hydrolase [Algoriphagus faecimaris]SDD04800.1 CubicO group peptidase, beta-lactamase class C family [Algoriphagus faecimaris]
MIKTISTLLLSLLLVSVGRSQSYFPDKGNWETKSPEELSLNPEKIKEAIEFAIANESNQNPNLKIAHYESAFGREPFGYPVGPMKTRGPATGLIIYKGYLVGQWGQPDRVDLTFSVAKSFLSTTAGLAVEKGLIQSEKDLVYPYMAPIYPYEPYKTLMNKSDHVMEDDVFELFDTDHNRKITWDHLLRQTSDWEGTLWGKPDWGDRPAEGVAQKRARPQNEPGSVYEYNDTRVNVLALALLNVWRKPLPKVLKEHIMDPIGASDTWRWTGYENSFIILDGEIVQSVSGGSHWGGGMMLSAWDQARFGYLTLRDGNWKGQQLISEEWLLKSKTPTPANPGYGFMNYFLNEDQKQVPKGPKSAFLHIGAGTNMIYVDQKNDLVIVARWIPNSEKAKLIELILESLPK